MHKKYLREYSGSKMGYTLFCKFRPFWVVKPGLTDRQTCLYKKHANLQFKADRLHQLGVLSEKYIWTLVEGLACDRQRIRCMYNVCPTCCSNVPKYIALDQDPNTHVIGWWEWVLKILSQEVKIFQMLPHCFMPWLTEERRLNSFCCLTVMSTRSQGKVPDNLLSVPGTMAIHHPDSTTTSDLRSAYRWLNTGKVVRCLQRLSNQGPLLYHWCAISWC